MPRRWHPAGKGDPNQLQILWAVSEPNWPEQVPEPVVAVAIPETPATAAPHEALAASVPDTPRRRKDIVARLPVPRPLPAAIAAGRFGQDEDGHPIRPAADEVRAITESQADKLIDLLDALKPAHGKPAIADKLPEAFGAILAAYAQDFGERPARQLEAYARRQSSLEDSPHSDKGWRR